MSVKNNIITIVLYIWREYEIIMKTIYHTMNVLSTKAELFIIRYSISQASWIQDIIYILLLLLMLSQLSKILLTYPSIHTNYIPLLYSAT